MSCETSELVGRSEFETRQIPPRRRSRAESARRQSKDERSSVCRRSGGENLSRDRRDAPRLSGGDPKLPSESKLDDPKNRITKQKERGKQK